MFATRKVKMERVIFFMRNRESAANFVRISHGSENFDYRC